MQVVSGAGTLNAGVDRLDVNGSTLRLVEAASGCTTSTVSQGGGFGHDVRRYVVCAKVV